MLRTPRAFVQYAKHEERTSPGVDTGILHANSQSYANEGPAIIAAEQVYHPPLQPIPTFGYQAMDSGISNLANLPGQMIAMQKARSELGVTQEKAKTEIQQQKQGQDYLNWLHDVPNPTTGEPLDLWKYNTQVGPGAAVSTDRAQWNPLMNTTKHINTGGGSGGSSGDGDQSGNGSDGNGETETPANPAESSFIQGGGVTPGLINGGQTQAAPATEAPVSLASAQSHVPVVVQPPVSQTDSSSPIPLNDPNALANRTHITPEEGLAWGLQNWRTDISHASQEFDKNGLASNRVLLHLKDGTAQPLHSQFALNNPGAGGWMSDLSTPVNPLMGAPPDKGGEDSPTAIASATPPVSAPPQNTASNPLLAQAINGPSKPSFGPPDPSKMVPPTAASLPPAVAMNGAAQAMNGSAQMSPAEALASGDPRATTQAISDVGGPQWTAAGGAQAPLYKNAPWLNNQPQLDANPHTTPSQSWNTTSVAPSTPQIAAQHDNANPPVDASKAGIPGKSAQEVLAQMTAKNSYLGPNVGNNPLGGHPSDIRATEDMYGNKGVMYVDPAMAPRNTDGSYMKAPDGGLVPNIDDSYKVIGQMPYGEEFRVYLNGKTKQVTNEVTKAQDTGMMNLVLKHGLATPEAWDNWTPQQKTSAYRQAFAADDENAKTYPEATKHFQQQDTVLDTGRQLQAAINKMGGDSPAGLAARGFVTSGANAVLNKVGGQFGWKDNPDLSDAQAKYAKFISAVRDMETTRPAGSADALGVGQRDQGNFSGSIGDLPDRHMLTNLNNYLTDQRHYINRDVDYALATHVRVPDTVISRANQEAYADHAVGSTPDNPVLDIKNDAQKNNLPPDTYFRVGNKLYRKGH